VVTGRMIEVSEGQARVELGEGIHCKCRMDTASAAAGKNAQAEPVASSSKAGAKSQSKPDLSSLGSMLQARWKGGAHAGEAKPEAARAGQIRKFRIVKLDAAAKKIELELA
jgi:small subunit ribosomal protein S1